MLPGQHQHLHPPSPVLSKYPHRGPSFHAGSDLHFAPSHSRLHLPLRDECTGTGTQSLHMLLARNESSFSLSFYLSCCALQSPRSACTQCRLHPTPVPSDRAGCTCALISCIRLCLISKLHLCSVRLEDRCFSSFPAFFFSNTVKEKHTHLLELGVLLTAEQSDGCARILFH